MPDPAELPTPTGPTTCSLQDNAAGVVREWWLHVPTAFWFIAERDTLTDEILRTYPARELFTSGATSRSRGDDA